MSQDLSRAGEPRVAFEIVAVAASAGGVTGVGRLLADLGGEVTVPVVVVQHMSEGFIGGMARWLCDETGLTVRVASDGELLTAGVIAVLIALSQGVNVAIYAAAVYTGVQIVENLSEPFVQQRTVYLAPALLLFSQAVMGALAGALGIVLAAPRAARGIVVV